MKKIFLIPTAVLGSTVAHAQTDSTVKKNMFDIKTDIFFTTMTLFSQGTNGTLTIEKGFKKKHSISLTGWYNYSDRTFSTRNNKTSFVFIIPEYKIYWEENNFKGFYSGLFLNQIITHNISTDTSSYLEYKKYILGGGIISGYQNYIKKKIVFDFLIGFGLNFEEKRQIIKQYGNLWDKTPSVIPGFRFAINIGYRFK